MAANLERDSGSTSLGRMFTFPETDQVINCAMGLSHPLDVAALKAALSASVVTCHPRFTSLLVGDPHLSVTKQHWQKTLVNIDDHIVIIPSDGDGDDEASVNAYLADLAASPPMSREKPLWEVHVLEGPKCLVFRMHHAIGDGNSLMSMLAACFGGGGKAEERRRKWRKGGVWGVVRTVWYTAAYGAALAGGLMGFKDEKTAVSGGEGVECWRRSVSTAKLKISDMMEVKKAIPNVTLNDVLLGVVASGLTKYLNQHSPDAVSKGIKVTTTLAANIRKHFGLQEMTRDGEFGPSWGNKVGSFLVPMKLHKSMHPLEHVKRMKNIMDCKKQSLEAHLSYSFGKLVLSYLGSRAIVEMHKRATDSTTLLVTNIVGPKQEIIIAGNRVSYIRLCISSMFQAIMLSLVSYKGNVDVQVSVAKDIIQDGDFLAKCFEKALLEMMHVLPYQY